MFTIKDEVIKKNINRNYKLEKYTLQICNILYYIILMIKIITEGCCIDLIFYVITQIFLLTLYI